MTDREGAGTGGGKPVTGGWRVEWPVIAMIAAVGGLVAIVNATSRIMESQTGGLWEDARVLWLQELSSVGMVVALSPLVGWMVHWAPPPGVAKAGPWLRVIGIHLAAATTYSVFHVVGMVWIRKLGYGFADATYIFAYRGDVVFPFVYEWRKDVLTYAASAAAFFAWGLWQAQRAADALLAEPPSPSEDRRIEVRVGTRTLWLDPSDIAWVEAAGNYVEIHTQAAVHLVRGTLAGFEERLAEHGFVRVHRSRLVNRARVSDFRSTPSGDLEIRLDDGRTVGGSRRFRSTLEG